MDAASAPKQGVKARGLRPRDSDPTLVELQDFLNITRAGSVRSQRSFDPLRMGRSPRPTGEASVLPFFILFFKLRLIKSPTILKQIIIDEASRPKKHDH